MHKIISENVFSFMELIENSGYEIMLVGGAVRNYLLDIAVVDLDMATIARPDDIVRICENAGLRYISIAAKFGTIIVKYHDLSFEITTLRKDVQNFGRYADVEFTNSFEIDSQRRDFTMNAIYMNKNATLFDYQNGLPDIKIRKIKFIGEPFLRIQEDYLRILRYYRFLSLFGEYQIDTEYIDVINQLKSNLKNLSSERIIAELQKTFHPCDSYKIIPHMSGVLNELFSIDEGILKNHENFICFSTMSSNEKIAILLMFSELSVDDIFYRYNLPKEIRKLLKLRKFVDKNNDSFYRNEFSSTHERYRHFFENYYIVKNNFL